MLKFDAGAFEKQASEAGAAPPAETQKHWKAVNSARNHGTKQPAPFFFSQEEKDALKAAKDQQLKDARRKMLQETEAAREKKRAEKEGAAKRQKTKRAKV